MGPLGIKPPRLRVAFIAVLAALAAMAVASPGAASAAPSLKLTCHPTTIEPGESVGCEAQINSGSAGTPAAGKVTFIKSAGPAVNLGSGSCQVQPASGGTGGCSLTITSGSAEGKVSIFALYSQTGGGLASGGSSFTIANKAKIVCAPVELVIEESTTCRVTIPGLPNSFAGPSGIVEWSAPSQHPLQEVDPECMLQPDAEGASCSVTFTPMAAGERQLVATYKGDQGGHPARTVSQTVKVLPGYETITFAECGAATAVTFSRGVCRAVVLVPGKGPAPKGKVSVQMENPDLGGFPDSAFPDEASCTLQPTGGPFHESDCRFRYEPHMLGDSKLMLSYPGSLRLLGSRGEIRFKAVKHGEATRTELDCQSVDLGEVGICFITVIDPGSDGFIDEPDGTVTISGTGSMGPKSVEFGADSCELITTPGIFDRTRCEIRYAPNIDGTLTIRAEYQGDITRHQVSKGEDKVTVTLPEAQ